MVPGGAALKGVKALSKLKNLSRLKKTGAVIAAEGVSAGAVGGTVLPEAGETRMENVLEAGAAGAIGAGVAPSIGRVFSKFARGAKKTPDAEKLLAEGVDLTPGQMAASPAISGLETVMEVTPFLARGTKKARKTAQESWNKKVMSEAAPEGATITETGTEGAKQMRNAVTNAYDKAWAGAGAFLPKKNKQMQNVLAKAKKTLSLDDARVLGNVMKEMNQLAATGGKKGSQTLDDILRRRIKSAGTDKYELSQILKEARATLRGSLGPKVKSKLATIDAKYPAYLTVRNAVGRAKQTDGLFTPAQLTTSVGTVGKRSAEIGEAAMQEAARVGRSTLGKKEGGAPLEWFRRIAGALPSPLPMKTAGRTLMGQTAPQRAVMRGVSDPRVQAMRELFSSGGASAAMFTE